ncbi:MAG: zinc-dependent metalloprotease [Flavobacteriaceae bacterium]
MTKHLMRNTFTFALIAFTFFVHAQKKTIDSLTIDYTADKGILTTYFNPEKGKLLLALNDSVLEKPFLMVSRYVKLPANYSAYRNAGSKTAESVISFELKNGKLLLKQQSYVNLANSADPIAESVVQNNLPPILGVFEKMNAEKETHLVDVSDFFSKDSPGFNAVGETEKKNYKIGSLDNKRSFIDHVKSFPKNTEITHTLTYPAAAAPRSNRSETLSFQLNHSIIALPEDPMSTRKIDHRVGWFSLEQYNYSSEELKSDNYRIATRWKLEPKDKEAYFSGKLSEPVNPIVFYLDPATPLKWRPYFKKGIEDWNGPFEKAGFKNAIIAKDPPTKEEDPDFSPEDVRYSVVRYVASTTRNATGPSVKDPRSGEIIESDVIWYHNHLRSYRNRYLLETGAANEKARTLNTPEEEIGEMMRRVIAHEVGHALGLPHNMKASSAYSVDSLRSATFTQKMGIAATIMDYARYNYVAQPGDKGIRFVRQMGPYDDYAIEWGYRFFENAEEEKKWLKRFVDERSLNPIYQFGYGSNDPNAQTENIGDDPVKATAYGLSNLKIVAKNLEQWTTEDGATYDDLNELYMELIGVYRRYIYHVVSLVGGVNETLVVKGQAAIPYKNVDKEKQKEALAALHEQLFKTQKWLFEPSLISKFEGDGHLDLISNLQKAALYRLMSTDRLNRMLSTTVTLEGDGMHPDELIESLAHGLIYKNSQPDLFERNLQLAFVERIKELLSDEKVHAEVKSILFKQSESLKKWLKKQERSTTSQLRGHFGYAQKRLTAE